MNDSATSIQAATRNEELVKLGSRLRELRLSRQIKLSDLAQSAGVSAGLLSQLERGVGNPSYMTLAKLATAFGVPISDLFGQEDESGDQYLVRKAERKRLSPPRGDATFELLTPSLRGKLEVLWIVVEPGGAEPNPYQHEGEECVLCVEGSADFHLGERVYSLEEGDSLTFPGSTPHWAVNCGDSPTTLLVAITPPSF